MEQGSDGYTYCNCCAHKQPQRLVNEMKTKKSKDERRLYI